MFKRLMFAAAGLALAAPYATATAETFELRALGNFQGQLQSSKIERPFFEGLEKATDGTFKVKFRTMDEVGLKGFDALRLTKLGIFDVMAMQLGYVSGDEPFLLGLDLPGVAPGVERARKVVEAYREPFSKRLLEKYDVVTLALWPYPGQVFYCKEAMTGIEDLKGRKVRTFTPAMAKLVEHFGGVPVSLAFSEVYPSLQRGVADCAITGSLSGNTAKWHEVTNYLYPLSIGWGIQAHVASKSYLDSLSPEARQTLIDAMKKMEEELWTLADVTFSDGVTCNTGGACEYGVPANMTLVDVPAGDPAKLQAAVENVVLPSWGESCDASFPECTKIWNETVGAAVGLSIK